MKKNNLLCILICFIVAFTCFTGTSCSKMPKTEDNYKTEDNEHEDMEEEEYLVLSGENIEVKYTLEDLKKIDGAVFEGLYSTINNWPTQKTYAARGIKIEYLLKDCGLYDKAQLVTIISRDGYKQSFTRNQILDMTQYYYVDGKEIAEVKSILAYEFKEDSVNLDEIKRSKPCLIIGQTDYNEHSNPVFVEDVAKIQVSFKEPDKWDNVFTFPESGSIDVGEKVKLQHKDFGLVKIYYTLDGSEPTTQSKMYNPSTYQPELNAPITVTEDIVIKAFAGGYGKKDSDVVTFEFKISK